MTKAKLIEQLNKLQHELMLKTREIETVRKDFSQTIVARDKAERLVDRLLKIIEDGVKESNFPRRAIP
jgi:hypothetical protein